METLIANGRSYEVSNVHQLAEIQPQLRAHMQARGFDAYGFVTFPRGGNAIAYRATATRAWSVVVKVR